MGNIKIEEVAPAAQTRGRFDSEPGLRSNRKFRAARDQQHRQTIHHGVTLNTYAAHFQEALKAEFEAGRLRDIGDSTETFTSLANAYPVSGSKIAWAHVPDSIEVAEEDHSLQGSRFIEFFDAMIERFNLVGPVVYVGDSVTGFALEGAVDAIRRALPDLISIPQHHYFIGPDYSWCLCLTMERDIGFGRSVRS